MYQLIYTSQAAVTFTEPMLAALLRQAQRRNEQVGLTGVLLYNDEHFVQVIEGSFEAITTLYSELLRDARHHTVVLLASGHVTARHFGDWAMSFHAIAPEQMARVRGYCTPEHLDGHLRRLSAPDEQLLDLIKGFMHSQGLKL